VPLNSEGADLLQTVKEVADRALEITAPDYIQFYPTTRCNMACGFCFNQGLQAMEDMTFTDFRHMVDILNMVGTKTIDIMGGEPTMHTGLLQCINYARNKEMRINISSNGTMLSVLVDVRDRFPEVMVGVSVNGRKSPVELAKVIKKKKLVVKTVMDSSLDTAFISELLSYDPAMVYLLYRDALEPAQLGETVPFDRFFNVVRSACDPSRIGSVYCSGFLPDTGHYPALSITRCPAGTTKLGILPDGSVYPCNLFFGFPEFRLGNILTTPFEEIWQNDLLGFFRSFEGNTCPQKDCILHDECHGGCPAHSYAHYGTLSAPEPRCMTAGF